MVLKEIVLKIPLLGPLAARISRQFFVMPLYVIRERMVPGCEVELDPALQSSVETAMLTREDVIALAAHEETRWSEAVLLQRLDQGEVCMGIRRDGELLAYTWGGGTPAEADWYGLDPLQENEAYLHDAYCFKAHRGQKLIPYLRRQMYAHFLSQGKDNYYSITTFTNTSSMRFKQKLGATRTKLCLFVRCTTKFQRSFLLKTYEAEGR